MQEHTRDRPIWRWRTFTALAMTSFGGSGTMGRVYLPTAHELEVVTDDGVRLWAQSSGHGSVLVLCHGGPGLWDYLAPVATLLGRFARVIRYDQRGCGRSSGAVGPYTIERSVADLEAVVRASGDPAPVVGGHSWGATLALLFALAHPDRMRGLMYMSGTGLEWPRWKALYDVERQRRLAPWDARHRELALKADRSTAEEQELVALGWATDYADPRDGLLHARDMLGSGHAINRRCSRELSAELNSLDPAGLERQCASLTVPVLVTEGELDPRPRGAVNSLVRSLPSVQRSRIDAAGHLPWVEAPEVVQGLIGEWLGRIG